MKTQRSNAFVTLLTTKEYLAGVIALKRSLDKTNSKFHLYCIVSGECANLSVAQDLLKSGVQIIEKKPLELPAYFKEAITQKNVSHWKNTYEKLYIFSLTQFKKIVYIDSDIFVMKNIDYLFDKPHMSACEDGFSHFENSFDKIFNAGIMVIEPKENETQNIIEFAISNLMDSERINEQIILNNYFKDWETSPEKELPQSLNVFVSMLDKYEEKFEFNDIGCAHFIGKIKPFQKLETIEDCSLYSEIESAYLDLIKDYKQKILSIVIPQYNEDETVLSLALDSIKHQQSVDLNLIEVVIIGDNGYKISNKWLIENYNGISPRYIYSQVNNGAGVSRNIGIREANGKWVMFLDADDALYNLTALNEVIGSLVNENNDIIFGLFVQDKGNRTNKVSSHKDITWVHGKFYRKEYLTENKIYFNENLRVEEDGYFNALAFQPTTKVVKLIFPFVFWRANPNSITRSEKGKWIINHFKDYIRANGLLLKEFRNRSIAKIVPTLESVLVYAYYIFQLSEWGENSKENTEAREKLIELINENKPAYNCISKNHIAHKMLELRSEVAKWQIDFIEKETFPQFIDNLGIK